MQQVTQQGMQQNSEFVRSFLRLSIVNILSNLMVPLAGIVDVAFLGHLSDIRYLAGVSLATVLFNYIYWTFGFLRMGTTGMTAQAVGRKDETGALAIGIRHVLIALAIGILILILQVPLRAIGFALLSATPEVKAAGQDYFHALIWGAPATLINFVLIGWYLGRGQSGKVLLLSAVSNGSNIVLDYFFVGQWGWASAGAGWSTALAQYLMLLVGLGLLVREFHWRDVQKVQSQLWERSALMAVFSLNRDIFIRTFVLVSTFALFTNLSSAFGTDILATNTVLLQVVTLAAYFIDGFAFATESYAGLFRGQNTVKGLLRLLQLAGGLSLGMGLLFAIAFILFPLPLFGLITNHGTLLEGVQQYVFWLLPVLAAGSTAYLLDGYFLGLTEGATLRRAAVLSTLIGFVPLAIGAALLRSPHLLWLALTLFMVARSVTLGVKIPQTLNVHPAMEQPPDKANR